MTERRPYRSKATQGPRFLTNDTLLCRECGQVKPGSAFRILKSGSHESYCRDCHNAINRAWRERAKEERKARYRAQNTRRTYDPKPCASCGAVFVPATHNQRYCCTTCRLDAKAARPQPKHRGVARGVNQRLRPQVLAQYGWTCSLCTGPIPRDVAPAHGLSLTLDHVIPLARGGPSSLDNLRPAHRSCNIAKKDRAGLTPEQAFDRYLRARLFERIEGVA